MKYIILAFLILGLSSQYTFSQSETTEQMFRMYYKMVQEENSQKKAAWFYPYFSNAHIPDFCFSNTDIPELNRKILANADSLVGKKVGKGICDEFILEVLKNSSIELTYVKKDKEKWFSYHWVWETTDSSASYTIYPGDIILYDNHIAIIYEILNSTEYIIIHQNFSGKRKNSHVGFGTVNFKEVYYGIIYKPTPTIFSL